MEIDTNLRIIQMVHSRPILYTKCKDFEERAMQWKEIADLLSVDVPWVKSRWHLLRGKFLLDYSSVIKGTQISFKYFNDMSFLMNHINMEAFDMHLKQNDLETQPEFVIEKKDIEDPSDDDSSNIFIELELDDSPDKDMIQMQQSFDQTTEISDDELDDAIYLPNNEIGGQQEPMVNNSKYKLDSSEEIFQIIELGEKDDSTPVILKESPTEETDEIQEKKSVPEINAAQQSESQVVVADVPKSECFQKMCSSPQKIEKHRCEDTIFGELVSATLRKMPSDKKKAVKREIMNILFT